ncbi:MAG: hypothetical protein GY940_19385 [bacterium]|nr:hypothetical protein [bacterium]
MVGSHHDGDDGIEGQNGFWLRRIYLGYNSNLGNGWSARVRFEMNSSAFESESIIPKIKNAHITKKLNGGLKLMAGIMEPPTWDRVEKFWGLRYIEKTAQDFFKFASSRDFGVAIHGKAKGGLVYTLMLGNYSSNKSEKNKGKAVYGRLGWENKTAFLDANGHYANDGSKDITFLNLFAGLKGSWGRFGVGYSYRDDKPEGGESSNNGIVSGFGVFKIGKKTEIYARYDHHTDLNYKDVGDYVPVPASDYKARFLIAGLNFKVHKMIQLSPNVKYVFYGEGVDGMKPDGDFYLNLTAKISFKSSLGGKK